MADFEEPNKYDSKSSVPNRRLYTNYVRTRPGCQVRGPAPVPTAARTLNRPAHTLGNPQHQSSLTVGFHVASSVGPERPEWAPHPKISLLRDADGVCTVWNEVSSLCRDETWLRLVAGVMSAVANGMDEGMRGSIIDEDEHDSDG